MPDWLIPFLGDDAGWKLVGLLAIAVVIALWRALREERQAHVATVKECNSSLLEGIRALDRAQRGGS